jgi:hypothetical protein
VSVGVQNGVAEGLGVPHDFVFGVFAASGQPVSAGVQLISRGCQHRCNVLRVI